MDEFDLEIKQEFIIEALMNLEETEGSFMELESAQDPTPLLEKIFRLAHNLKGGSRAVGFGSVAEFTHELENLVLKIQKSEVSLSSEVVTTLLKSNDQLIFMLNGLKENLEAEFDSTDLITEIRGWLSGGATAPQDPQPIQEASDSHQPDEPAEATEPLAPSADLFFTSSEDEGSSEANSAPEAGQSLSSSDEMIEPKPLDSLVQAKIPKSDNLAKPDAVTTKPQAPSSGPKDNKSKQPDEVVRVGLTKINRLNDYVGELIVLQSVIQQQAFSDQKAALMNSVRQMQKTAKEIQNIAMSFRMLPVRPLVQKLQRVVRDTAQALQKAVELEIEGEHVDIDKSVLDEIADPLIHILRNAVDHGLESIQERGDLGKDLKGTVRLSFANEGNHLVVQIKDDGKGINAEVLKEKAIKKGLIKPDQSLTEKEALRLIFHPGFSTKEVTSEISGRGVGMDVVKTNIEKMGGLIDIQTEVGRGSTFTLQIPLSLAIIESLIVKGGPHRYCIPLNSIQESVNLRSFKVFESKLGVGPCFELRGDVVPLYCLSEMLGGTKTQSPIGESIALVVPVEGQLIALVVDDIVKAQQVVIKPFGNGLLPQKGWVGTCILGDGQPTLILNPIDLLQGRIRNPHSSDELRGVA